MTHFSRRATQTGVVLWEWRFIAIVHCGVCNTVCVQRP